MATTTPAPTPAPAPTPTEPSKWKDPATYLHLLATLLSALFASGQLPATSEATRIATIIALILGALGYPVVTSVANSASARSLEIRARAARVAAGAVSVVAAFMFVLSIGMVTIGTMPGCAGAKAFGSCTVSSLEQDVGDGTLAQAVEKALDSADYAGAIAGLITKIGEQEVACAVLAIAAIEAPLPAAGSGSGSAVAAGSGSGSAAPALTPKVALRKARALEMIAKYKWR